jgi:hypothetical protein
MRIRFLEAYVVNAVDGKTYKKGQVVELSEASAWHFLNKQVAVVADGTPEQASMVAPEKAVIPESKPRKMKDVATGMAAIADSK